MACLLGKCNLSSKPIALDMKEFCRSIAPHESSESFARSQQGINVFKKLNYNSLRVLNK